MSARDLNAFTLFFRAARARAYPRIWGMSREPAWIFFDIVVPLINLAAFVYLYRALHAPEEYVGFLILGAVISAYWLNVVWAMGTQLHWEKKEGTLQLYVMSPSSLMAVLVGMSAGGMFQASLRAGLILVISSLLFGVHLSVAHVGHALLIFAVTLIALYGLGMTLSSVFLRWGREAWQLALALHEPVFFLTGMNFPLVKLFQSVPGVLTVVSALIPISFGLDAIRQLLFPGQIAGVLATNRELLILSGLSVLYLFTAYWSLKRMEWLARVEATLSLRWQ